MDIQLPVTLHSMSAYLSIRCNEKNLTSHSRVRLLQSWHSAQETLADSRISKAGRDECCVLVARVRRHQLIVEKDDNAPK